MSKTGRLPHFFIVGAPKCGTTAMYDYLKDHPDVFMPVEKEPHHFSTDVSRRFHKYRSREAYAALFDGVTTEQVVGDASPSYMYSKEAASNIHTHDPNSKILIMLRNPVDWIASWHSQLVFTGTENILDLRHALAAEDERRAGRLIPASARSPQTLLYSEVGRFTEQAKRYLDLFGRDQVHFIVYDDLRQDTEQSYVDLLRWLKIDDAYRPDFSIRNPNKKIRHHALNRFLIRPPELAKSVVRMLTPLRTRQRMRDKLRKANMLHTPRTPMHPELRKELERKFAPEVRSLSALLGRNLTHWCGEGAADG